MNNYKWKILYLLGLIFSVAPPLLAVICYFPLWHMRGSEFVISGLAALLFILAALPLLRIIRDKLRSPSAYLIWLIIFLLFFALSKIAKQMIVISFIGFLGNLTGALFFKLSNYIRHKAST